MSCFRSVFQEGNTGSTSGQSLTQGGIVEGGRVDADGLLFRLFPTVDGRLGIFGEDNRLGRAVAGTGRAIVLAVLWCLHDDLFPLQGIDAKQAEVMAFATVTSAFSLTS